MRKLIIVLSVIFYASSLLIVIAALIAQPSENFFADGMISGEVAVKQPVQKEIRAEEDATSEIYQPKPQMNEDVQPASDEEVTGKLVEMDLVDTVQSGGIKESVLLATLSLDTLLPGQDLVNIELVQAILEHVPAILEAIPEHHILIEGHTDSLPIRKSSDSRFANNRELSFMRAKATVLILEGEGVPSRYIIAIGSGDERPVASNASPQGRAKNRRIEIWLVPVDSVSRKNE